MTARVLKVGPQVEDVKPGDVVGIPGVAKDYPDWERQEIFLITQGDIGWILSDSI